MSSTQSHETCLYWYEIIRSASVFWLVFCIVVVRSRRCLVRHLHQQTVPRSRHKRSRWCDGFNVVLGLHAPERRQN